LGVKTNHYLPIFLLLLVPLLVGAQHSVQVLVLDEFTGLPLAGANVQLKGSQLGCVTDTLGLCTIAAVPNGEQEISVSYLGYRARERELDLPLRDPAKAIKFELEPSSEDLREVHVSTTRSSRSIQEIPTRIELITMEELDEKNAVHPSDIKLLLNESTGIAVQATSAASGIANFRMQGLDGRYSQILRDGMPIYQGFSNGMSAVQVAPLDLKQVEYIKGSASTLYGGGAIAGIVNLISRTPGERRDLELLLNATSTNGFDAAGFWAKKGKKIGGTLYSAYNYNAPYAPGSNPFTAIPRIRRYTLDPKLFIYFNDKTTMNFGINAMYEDRTGGDKDVLKRGTSAMHQFREQNKTQRVSTQFRFDHQIDDSTRVQVRNAVSFFDRRIYLPGFFFDALQYSTFTEFNFSRHTQKAEWVVGMNIQSEDFRIPENAPGKDYTVSNIGLFCQNIAHLSERLALETGMRIDYHSPYNDDHLHFFFPLPRLSLLVHWNDHLVSRIGGGLGYKMPSIFLEEAEEDAFRTIQPVDIVKTDAEKSLGGNADLNYAATLGEVQLSFNQLFFLTRLNKPLVLLDSQLVNANGHLRSAGFESNLRLRWEAWHFWAGYSFTEVRQYFNGNDQWKPLTPRHRLNAVLAWEEPGNFRFVVEGLYVGKQRLSDNRTGKDYAIFGVMAEKVYEKFSLFLACENLSNVRQDRFDTFFTGTVAMPTFQGVYAPLEGRTVNAGIRLRL
jgi:iron complex outermembrane receptor protein